MFPGSTYDSQVVHRVGGDSVLFATDGLHAWRNRAGIEFGAQQIGEIWFQGKSADESIDHMFASLQEFSQGSRAHDHTTAVVLKVGA
jgi:serine phosphatase RsbU (regulator of sigma subunit)